MDFVKKKAEIWKQQNLLSKIGSVTVFTSVIQFEKKNYFFVLGQNWESMSSLIEAREKGAKKAKKMDFAKTKTDIYKQQNLLSKIRCVTVFTSVIKLKKKNKNLILAKNDRFWILLSNLSPFLTSKGYKWRRNFWPENNFFLIGHRVYL